MQSLIPVAFKENLPVSVWGPLAELSQFFHALCSPTLSVARMQELDNAIPLLLCKLERIFPPSFFDSMEHLLIHLSYEAKIAGPVQYRWMYPFERCFFYSFIAINYYIFLKTYISNNYTQVLTPLEEDD